MSDGGDEAPLASLIERSAELKRALVDFACGPRFERHLAPFMLEAAGPEGERWCVMVDCGMADLSLGGLPECVL